eukprot:scaffold1874_cov109-Isochrysis_galbana.AAC.3
MTCIPPPPITRPAPAAGLPASPGASASSSPPSCIIRSSPSKSRSSSKSESWYVVLLTSEPPSPSGLRVARRLPPSRRALPDARPPAAARSRARAACFALCFATRTTSGRSSAPEATRGSSSACPIASRSYPVASSPASSSRLRCVRATSTVSLAPKSVARATVASPGHQIGATYPPRPPRDVTTLPATEPDTDPATDGRSAPGRPPPAADASPTAAPVGLGMAPADWVSRVLAMGAVPSPAHRVPRSRNGSQSMTTKPERWRLLPTAANGARQYWSAVRAAAAPVLGSTSCTVAPMRETRASGLSEGATPLGRSTRSSLHSGAISMAHTCRTLEVPVRALAATSDDDALHRHGASEHTPRAKRCASCLRPK